MSNHAAQTEHTGLKKAHVVEQIQCRIPCYRRAGSGSWRRRNVLARCVAGRFCLRTCTRTIAKIEWPGSISKLALLHYTDKHCVKHRYGFTKGPKGGATQYGVRRARAVLGEVPASGLTGVGAGMGVGVGVVNGVTGAASPTQ